MKIISLNCYMGVVFEPLMEFIKKESVTTDVFCLQEMLSNPKEDLKTLPNGRRGNLLQELVHALPDFTFLFVPTQDDYEVETQYEKQIQLGNVTFYRTSLPTEQEGNFFIYNGFNTFEGHNKWETLGHVAVYLTISGGQPLTIVNLHGNSQPADKRDSEKRIEQSQKILDFVSDKPGEKVVIGDFNLFPDTKSIRMFEDAGFRNLITIHKIKTTRGSHMRILFPEYEHGPHGFQEYADYAFVSPGINVTSFEVPDVPISDHIPLILEIER